MGRLVGWHTRAGEIGLRLFQLHLLWLAGTLAGGVLLGAFPATAAVHAVVRRDILGDEPRPLVPEFAAAWRREFRTANVLGYALAALWVLLLWPGQLLGAGLFGAATPLVAGVRTIALLALALVSAHAFALAAHFDDGPAALLRRSAVMAVARPLPALGNALVWAVVLATYHAVPGLAPVFGVAVPAYLSFGCLWSAGVLPPRPDGQAGVFAPL